MKTSIEKFNALNGAVANRSELKAIANQAKAENRNDIAARLNRILNDDLSTNEFELSIEQMAFGEIPSNLAGIDFQPETDNGLGEAVSPNEIYDFITQKIIDLIESGKELSWRQEWNPKYITSTNGAALNFVSKNPYRGINYFLLNILEPMARGKQWDIPYFLTFEQIKEKKGQLKKGSEGYKVIYFTRLYQFLSADEKINIRSYNKQKFIQLLKDSGAKILKSIKAEVIAETNAIPILKYYNVFNADDITGINWSLKPAKKKTEAEKIEIAEAIVNYMPKAPVLKIGGKDAFYSPSRDIVQMPIIDSFSKPQFYYSTLFHELVHSTMHESRLNDASRRQGKKFGDKHYAFEELVAELGASFLNAESGILYHTLNNNAAYLKSWKASLLKIVKEDNKFFFRASSKAQAAADFILKRDADNIPTYLKHIEASNKVVKAAEKIIASPKKVTKKPTVKAVDKVKPTAKPKPKKETKQLTLFGAKSIKGLGNLPEGFILASDKKVHDKAPDTFRLPGPIGEFLQDLQRFRLAIVLTGDPHAGKSEFAKQIIDAFIDKGFTVGMFDLEQGGMMSKDTEESIKRNIKPQNLPKLAVTGEAPKGFATIKQHANAFDVIFIDSFQKLNVPNTRFDELRIEHPNTMFIVIYQQNGEGGTRGGVSADYDTPIKIKVHKVDDTFVNNYAELQKNRGNMIGLKYNISKKQIVKEVADQSETKS
jgi:antirestriction protein ArdC